MATSSKKSTPYKSPSISRLTNSKVTIPKVAPASQSKIPQVTIPKVAPGPQSTPQSKIPQVTIPKVAPGPQSKIPTPYKSPAIQALTTTKKSGSGSKISPSAKATTESAPTLEGTDNFTPIALQSFARSSSAGSAASVSSGGASAGSGGGASGSAAKGSSAQLERMNAEALRLQEMVNNLAAKEQTAATEAVVSDSAAIKAEKDAEKRLKKMMQPVDDGLDLLDAEIARNEQLLQQEMSSIQAAYDVQKTGLEGEQLNETGQTSVGLANAGGYLGFSGSGTGVMLKLAESHRAELVSLESQRQNAIMEANNAAAERRFDMVQTKVDEIARIDQEKYERTQEYHARVKENAEVEKVKAERKQTEDSIFTAIRGGAKSIESIYNQLGGKVSVKEISDFLDSIAPSEEGMFKFTPTNTASLLGVGLGQDDIRALTEYVNENGYDETVRSNLTPTQRVVADKIFRATATGAGVGKYNFKLTPTNTNELAGAGFTSSDIEAIESSVNQFGVEATLAGVDDPDQRAALAEILKAESALDRVEAGPATVEGTITSIMGSITDEQLKKLKTLADTAEVSSIWKGKRTDVQNLLNTPEMNAVIQSAIDRGLEPDEILNALIS